jgi:MarR family transcriptional regulator, temperature-dependent positive regulator of motility
MNPTAAENNQAIAYRLSNSLSRLLREFSRDFEKRIGQGLDKRGYSDIRPSHSAVLANLGTGAVRVTELAERAQVTQQAMGKMLKELESMGYVARGIDNSDKRAKEIRLTQRGISLAIDSLEVVDEVRSYYTTKIGTSLLDELEAKLRDAVRLLQLDYLPASWVDMALEPSGVRATIQQ